MTTYDRHIIRRLAGSFALLVGVLIVFFIVLHYVEYVDDFIDRGATMAQVWGTYYPRLVPEIVRLTAPLALFLATVYLMGKLAQTLQIAALRAAGVTITRLLRPFAFVGFVLFALMVGFNGYVVPHANRTVLDFERQYLKNAPRQTDISDVHRQDSPGTLVSVGYYDRRDTVAHRVSLQTFADGSHLARRLDATRMTWIDSLGAWRMHGVTERDFTDAGVVTRARPTLDTTLALLPRYFARTERDVETMTLPDAREYVEELRAIGVGGIGRPLVGYYSKLTYPLACLVVVLLGVPLAAKRRRGGQAMQLALGLAVAFLYLSTVKIFEPLGYAGTLTPLAAALLPHVAFGALAVVLLMRAR